MTSGSVAASSPCPPTALADERAGIPARTTSPANTATPASASAPAAGRRRAGKDIRGANASTNGRAAQTIASAPSTATLLANSVPCGAMSSTASTPTDTPKTRRPTRPVGTVLGSVIMKNRKTRISGEKTSARQKAASEIGPRCQRAVIAWPLAASTAIPPANAIQKPAASPTRWRRLRIANPPVTMIASASASHTDIGPHQKSSGSAYAEPRIRKQATSPKFDGLKMCRPFHTTMYLESSDTAAVPAKIHQPCRLHQSPCSVPGTRRMNATPFPVRSALAGHMITCWRKKVIPTSSTAQVPIETRICAIERRKSNATCPRICSETITAARCRRGSRIVGSRTGYDVPRIRSVGGPVPASAGALIR